MQDEHQEERSLDTCVCVVSAAAVNSLRVVRDSSTKCG